MASDQPVEVRLTRRFEASPERVFDAFLDPAKARRFMFATPDGEMLRADIDARVGGTFNFTERRGEQKAEHVGRYMVIERPRRLVFTFSVDNFASEDLVTIDIVARGTGCELTLTHALKPELAAYKERAQSGWGKILEGLGRAVG